MTIEPALPAASVEVSATAPPDIVNASALITMLPPSPPRRAVEFRPEPEPASSTEVALIVIAPASAFDAVSVETLLPLRIFRSATLRVIAPGEPDEGSVASAAITAPPDKVSVGLVIVMFPASPPVKNGRKLMLSTRIPDASPASRPAASILTELLAVMFTSAPLPRFVACPEICAPEAKVSVPVFSVISPPSAAVLETELICA